MHDHAKLPIGIQAFEVMRTQGYVYVDKTAYIYRLATEGMFYFLSRPRRFGKSLLLSTLQCLFAGRKDLFEGLWIAEQSAWDWQAYPVIQISFNEIPHQTPEMLQQSLNQHLQDLAERNGMTLDAPLPELRFKELIGKLHQTTTMPAVILIDEYDKPMIDHLGQGAEGLAIAKANRDVLRSFFGVLKGLTVAPLLQLVFLTGVSKFSKVSIFSELNNLQDLTMDDRYAEMLGYTPSELDHYFPAYLEAFAAQVGCSAAEIKTKIARHYNGYRFSDRNVTVANPFSILNAFSQKKFKPYWFETGTPTFLIRLLQAMRYDLVSLEGLEVTESLFTTYDLDRLQPEALLFQTGYLTIQDVRDGLYRLGYPNQEVKHAFVESLLLTYAGPNAANTISAQVFHLAKYLQQEDWSTFFETVAAIFAAIPYTLNTQRDEAYFHTMFYLMLSASGLETDSEPLTSRGRIDLAVRFAQNVYLMELKCNQSADAAIRQIRAQGYAEKYHHSGKKIVLIGINFDPDARNIADWKVESD